MSSSHPELEPIRITPYDPDRDDVSALTVLLHAAYGAYAVLNLRYTAATQTDDVTRARLQRGTPLIARRGAEIVGTATYYSQPTELEAQLIPWYCRSDVGTFGQFAVKPDLQKSGLGVALLVRIEQLARDDGKDELACETAAPNEPLVAYYVRRGFHSVGGFRWPGDTFDCVVLSKPLR